MCKSLKNANIACSSTSSRAFTSSRLHLIMNDLYHMFVEKSSSFDLQRHQMRSFFSKIHDKCNLKSNCDFIQSRITLYFHAIILFAFKSIKFEAFASAHVSMKHSTRTSSSRISRFSFSMRLSFSTFSRLFFVCRHCQKRFVIYWFIDWVTSNVSKVENNEIFMRMRYWRFAFLHSTLKKYWFSWDHYFEKISMLFVCFVHSLFLVIVDRFEKALQIVVCFVLLFHYDRDLFLWFRFDLTRLIIVSIFYYFLRLQSSDKYEKKKMTVQFQESVLYVQLFRKKEAD